MKIIVKSAMVVTVAVSICLSAYNGDKMENCVSENEGWCSESLDYDYTSEEVQIDNGILCEKYSVMYCKDEISSNKFEELVENLSK